MAFGSFSEGGNSQPMVEINTTPLVDVMLVLLVIFIITAPLFHQAVPIDLPKVDSTRLDDKPKVIQVALDAAGQVYLDGEAVAAAALDGRLAAARDGNPELHLRADKATRYERVAEVMAAAQKAGIVKIAFVTDPKA
ncbi:MAG: biopolymer transporter ExbD [Sterolibacteriaceae bacterium MAG5]|nr:biopolymer transporter ExbD [Candidatus Nitricoxidireducens bremensis]